MVPGGTTVVLFDGVCNLCNRVVLFIIDRDPHGRCVFAPLQSPAAQKVLGPLGYRVAEPPESFVVVEDGRIFERSAAALRIARHLAWPWRWAAALAHLLPLPLRDLVYRFIATRRYRWFGRSATCRLPTPELQSRFLG
jgi:predicted DCC family thiol-disulfide oxidoreductase YuxK